MKKLIIFLFIISIVAGSFCFLEKPVQIFDVSGVDEVCFVSGEKCETAFETVQCGDKYFNYFSFDEAKKEVSHLKNLDAVQFYADQTELDTILKEIKFVSLLSEQIENIEIVYGFSPLYNKAIYLEGKKVNVQIAKVQDRVILGFPMILTGY